MLRPPPSSEARKSSDPSPSERRRPGCCECPPRQGRRRWSVFADPGSRTRSRQGRAGRRLGHYPCCGYEALGSPSGLNMPRFSWLWVLGCSCLLRACHPIVTDRARSHVPDFRILEEFPCPGSAHGKHLLGPDSIGGMKCRYCHKGANTLIFDHAERAGLVNWASHSVDELIGFLAAQGAESASGSLGCQYCGRPEGCSMCRATSGTASSQSPAATSAGPQFKKLHELRWQRLRPDGPTVELTCGSCRNAYTVPAQFVREYLSELAPGAALRRFDNRRVRAQQQTVRNNLRCARCGAIDPGAWVAGSP